MSEFPQPNLVNPEPPPPPESATINTGGIHSGFTNIGPQYLNMVVESVNEYFDDGRRASARRFSDRDVCDVSDPREDELKALYIGDDDLTEALVAVLDRERVLFLTGERGIGKQTTALYVATRVADAHDLERSTAL